jgi:mRNA-degrading endonuclease toxin of MazEF toxin-antitoxin module
MLGGDDWRGRVYEGQINGEHRTVVVVSSGARNVGRKDVIVAPVISNLPEVLRDLPTVVELGDAEPVSGSLLTDYVAPALKADLEAATLLGVVSSEVVRRVRDALQVVFGPT